MGERNMNALKSLAMAFLVALVVLCAATFASAAEPGPAEPRRGPHDTSGWIGTNYTPAYAVNAVQMWHDFRPDVIDRELAAAKEHFALTTLRVYLHYIVYRKEKAQLLVRIERFLQICRKHGIRPGFVFFDDCWQHKGITLRARPPVDGRHNGRWAAVQDVDRTDENLPMFQAYVQDIVRPHAADGRVLWWEIYNEPKRKDPFTAKLIEGGRRWIEACRPTQPILCCWNDNPQTDIVNAHNYSADFASWDRQADMNARKGTVFTEAGARWYQGKGRSNGSPVEVIRWLRRRKAAGKTVPGVYLCWELMVGNSHCRWYWGTKDGAAEPAIPWCGLLWPDGTPVSLAEAEAVRSYVTGKRRAMLFEDFDDATGQSAPTGWRRLGGRGGSPGVAELSGSAILIAGDESWSDYVLEATVMLKADGGNAGVIFRVTKPGDGDDAMRGYYVGIDPKRLYLGKIENNRQPLAEVDLTRLPNPPAVGAWSRIRIAVAGPRIRVWLNPVHDDLGPRIDYTDSKPIRRGAVGLRTHRTTAWFDDVVVLPISALPKPKPAGGTSRPAGGA